MLLCKECNKIYFEYFMEIEYFNKIECCKKEKYLLTCLMHTKLYNVDSERIYKKQVDSCFGSAIESHIRYYYCPNNHKAKEIYQLLYRGDDRSYYTKSFNQFQPFIVDNKIDLNCMETKELIVISDLLKALEEIKVKCKGV